MIVYRVSQWYISISHLIECIMYQAKNNATSYFYKLENFLK